MLLLLAFKDLPSRMNEGFGTVIAWWLFDKPLRKVEQDLCEEPAVKDWEEQAVEHFAKEAMAAKAARDGRKWALPNSHLDPKTCADWIPVVHAQTGEIVGYRNIHSGLFCVEDLSLLDEEIEESDDEWLARLKEETVDAIERARDEGYNRGKNEGWEQGYLAGEQARKALSDMWDRTWQGEGSDETPRPPMPGQR